MQHRLIVLIFILISSVAIGADNEIKLNTKITDVTVYEQNALVHRQGKITVPKGNSSIIIHDLHKSIRSQDVRVNAKGDFSILSISYRYHTDTLSGKNGHLQRLEINNQIEVIKERIRRETGYLDIYNKEEQMILANQNFTHKEEGVDIDRLAKASDFFRTRLFDIKEKRLEVTDLVASLQREIDQLYEDQAKIEGLTTKTTLEMIVKVNAELSTKGTFTLDYRAYNAGWTPSYDAIVENVSEPLDLEYKAKVYQNTGEDWEDVTLTVATGNPNVNKKKPNLLPWYVRANKPRQYNNSGGNQTDYNAFLRSQPYNKEIRQVRGQVLDQSGEPIPFANVMCYGTTQGTTTDLNGQYTLDIPANVSTLNFSTVGYIAENLYVSGSIMNVILKTNAISLNEVMITNSNAPLQGSFNQFGLDTRADSYQPNEEEDLAFFKDDATDFAQVSVSYSAINTKFEIDAVYSIPSDGKEYAVQIQEHELDAHYIFQCTPKLDETAYLTAQITDWEDLNLLAGPMNIYFEDEFIGSSQLDLGNAEDTLNLSLGEDKNIFIERRKIKSENKKQVLGSHKVIEREFEILVRNNKRENVTIIIEDQVPLSSSDDVEVEAETLSGGKLNEVTGKIRWTLDLNSGKKKTLKFKYSVKYPKSMYLNV